MHTTQKKITQALTLWRMERFCIPLPENSPLQCTYYLCLQKGLNFFKCSHPYTKNLKHLRMCSSHLLFYLYYWEISWHGISWKHTLRMLLDKRGHKLMSWIDSSDFAVLELLTISANIYNFLVKKSTFKQVIKLTLGPNKFGTRTMQNSQTRMLF